MLGFWIWIEDIDIFIRLLIELINYQVINPAALCQTKRMSIRAMRMWHRRVTRLYSTTSKRNQIIENPATIAAVNFLSFHSKISATAKSKQNHITIEKYSSL